LGSFATIFDRFAIGFIAIFARIIIGRITISFVIIGKVSISFVTIFVIGRDTAGVDACTIAAVDLGDGRLCD
jgi:hypothetical protein